MKRSKFSEEQIAYARRQADGGHRACGRLPAARDERARPPSMSGRRSMRTWASANCADGIHSRTSTPG